MKVRTTNSSGSDEKSSYFVGFDEGYFQDGKIIKLPDFVQEEDDIVEWLDAFPLLKREMDRYFARIKSDDECEFQQLVTRENNQGRVARSTDYFVCDIEYQDGQNARFDMIAVHWPSKPGIRRVARNRRLVLVEVKYGDGSLDNMHKHIKDANNYLGDPGQVSNLKEDMACVFNQKRDLGFMDCERDLISFSDEPPILLLVLANHDPEKSRLREILKSLPDSPNAELCIATASFFGCGLYDQGIHTVDEALLRFPDYIYSGSRS